MSFNLNFFGIIRTKNEEIRALKVENCMLRQQESNYLRLLESLGRPQIVNVMKGSQYVEHADNISLNYNSLLP